MKLKYYFRGLGIGILVTTIIFMIGIHVKGDELLSDEEILKRAQEIEDATSGEDDTKTLEELEAEQKANQKKREEQQKAEEEKAKKEAEAKEQQDAAQPADQQAQEKDQAAQDAAQKADQQAQGQQQAANQGANQTETVKQVELNIMPGEYSMSISQKLQKAGLIASVEEFNQYITEHDYDNMIQPGTFVIPQGASYEEIAKILTTKQENR